MTIALWFKRDLRVEDHPALSMALDLARAQGVKLLPFYVIEPDLWAQSDASARQYRFVAESLKELQSTFARLGHCLTVRVGKICDVLEALHTSHGFTHLVAHEEIGTLWTYKRDLAVGAWARGKGVQWCEVPQSGVQRKLPTRDVWSKKRDHFMRQAPLQAPETLCDVALIQTPESCEVLDARDIGLAFDPCHGRQKGGRAQAMSLLGSFLTQRGQNYRSEMSTPLEGASACSRLSPHFAWGTMTPREADVATRARMDDLGVSKDDMAWRASLKSFRSRLAWRDHFMQKLEDQPDLDRVCLHSAYEGLRPQAPHQARLQAWKTGQTGQPFLDACLRSLKETGWLNFRMRSMVMAIASYHLWLDWRHTGPWLAQMFTDYEPGIHWAQVQMQSGTTGINTLRIYNPVKQGRDQDPTGAFTRKWVPELAQVPDGFLQEPWLWPANTAHYAKPIVNFERAGKAAKDRIWRVRASDTYFQEAKTVVQKHGSRKDKARRFVRDSVVRPKPSASSQQLGFDF